MKYHFNTVGTCSRAIDFEIEDGVIKNVIFTGGCAGNTQGVAALAKGRRVEELVCALKGTKCGNRGTSCPDQLATALEQAMAQEQ